MIIATFGPTTAWAGKTVTREGDVFTLEGHGPITAADVMEYDRQGHLVWANDGMRAWVGSQARSPVATAVPDTPPKPDAPARAATQQSQATVDIIATFNSSTIWAGKRISYVHDGLVLEGFGPIAPQAVLDFDRQGHLEWSAQERREWVSLLAVAAPQSVVTREALGRYSVFWQVLAALAVFFVALVILSLMVFSSSSPGL